MAIIGQTFAELVSKSDEQVISEARAIAQRQLARKIQSSHDDALTQIMRLRHSINKYFEGFRTKPVSAANEFDFNEVNSLLAELNEYEQAAGRASQLHNELFGSPLEGLAS